MRVSAGSYNNAVYRTIPLYSVAHGIHLNAHEPKSLCNGPVLPGRCIPQIWDTAAAPPAEQRVPSRRRRRGCLVYAPGTIATATCATGYCTPIPGPRIRPAHLPRGPGDTRQPPPPSLSVRTRYYDAVMLQIRQFCRQYTWR